jgi:general secretion pathway protein K
MARPGMVPFYGAVAERGVVLVVVLWLLVLLSVLVGTQAGSARVESELVRTRVDALQARSAAEAGLFMVIDMLATQQGAKERLLRTDGGSYRLTYHGVALSVSVQDEAGKMDLNAVSPDMLRRLLLSLSASPEKGRAVCDAILDWRDVDDKRREHGAEDEDYLKNGLAYGAKDEYLDNLEELLLILGMDGELYATLLDVVTVSTGAKGINPLVASRRVLLAVPGVTKEQVDEFLLARERYYSEGQPSPLFPVSDLNYISRDRDQLYSIRAQAVTAGGVTERVSVLARVSAERAKSGVRPYEILSWSVVDHAAAAFTPQATHQ